MRVSNNSKGIEIEGGASTHDWSVDKLVAAANTTGLRVRGESYDMSITDSNFVNNEFGFTSYTYDGDTPPRWVPRSARRARGPGLRLHGQREEGDVLRGAQQRVA